MDWPKVLQKWATVGMMNMLWLSTHLMAQTPAFLHYGVHDGLPSNLIYCGIQDRRGLMWFGTDKGLACFDGSRFRTFGVKDGLTDPEVLNLMEDSGGRLWISSYRKKPCYRKNGRFVTEHQDSLLAKMQIKSALWDFFEDDDRSVWLSGHTNAMLHLKDDKLHYEQFERSILRPGRIDGTLFFFGVSGIYRQQPGGELAFLCKIDAPPLSNVNPYRGFSISGNRILYAFIDKLLLLEWRDGTFRELDRRPGPIGRVSTDSKGRFWVCSLAEGAVCFDNDRRDLSNPKFYCQGDKVTSMFEDRQGTLWFCTTNNGVYALPENVAVNFSVHNGFISNNITALARDDKGRLWSGDDEGNLYVYDGKGRFYATTLGSADGYNRVRRIIPDVGDSRWVVTDEALYRETGHTLHKINLRVSPKTALLQPGQLWCASSGGLICLDANDLSQRMAVGYQRFTALSEDSDGNVWAGMNEGLLCEADSFSVNWGDHYPVLSGRVVAIEKAGKDSLWIVTPGKGLLLVRVLAGKIVYVERAPRDINDQLENIQSLFSEPNGLLWLATNRGVYRLDKSWGLVRFDRNNGLADDDVNAVLVHGDTVWTATVSGLSRLILRPSQAGGDFATLMVNAAYRTKEETIELDLLNSVPAGRKVILPPDATLFEVKFTGLDYRSRGNLRYEVITTKTFPAWQWCTFDNLFEWMGRGFRNKPDTTWFHTDNPGIGVRLPPARYHLRITAVTAAGVHSLQPDFWTIEMRPHRTDTVWFWLLIWGVFSYIVWRVLRARNAFRKLDAAASELQLQALQSQMNPHFVGNSINAIQQFFYPPDPVRASEYISLFTRLLRRTLSYTDRTFISFTEEFAYVRDYLEMTKLRFGEFFQYEISGADSITSDTPFPSMLLQPILENATIHGLAPEGVSILKLDFHMSGTKLVCTVTDNGAGLLETHARQKVNGSDRQSKGLEILRRKVDTLNRRFDLGLQLELSDLSTTIPPLRGTRAVIRFNPGKIPFIAPGVKEALPHSIHRSKPAGSV